MSSVPSLPQGFTLHPFILPDDIPKSVDLCRLAFESDALEQYLVPAHLGAATARREWAIQRSQKQLTDPAKGPRQRYIKIVKNAGVEDEEVVAVAGWWAPRVGKEGAKSEEEKAKERQEIMQGFPEGAKKEEAERIFGKIEGLKKALLGENWEEKYWYLGTLATKPAYNRLGLGSALIQWGVLQAEAQVKESSESPVEGLYLESTPTGLPVYLRNGFREVASLTHDLGEGKEYKHVCVLRKTK